MGQLLDKLEHAPRKDADLAFTVVLFIVLGHRAGLAAVRALLGLVGPALPGRQL